MTNRAPKAPRWGHSLGLLLLMGIVTASWIGYAVGFRMNGYSAQPVEILWAAIWIVLAVGFVTGRALIAVLLSLLGFLTGLIASSSLIADPYTIWGLRALFSLLSLMSATFALLLVLSNRNSPQGTPD